MLAFLCFCLFFSAFVTKKPCEVFKQYSKAVAAVLCMVGPGIRDGIKSSAGVTQE